MLRLRSKYLAKMQQGGAPSVFAPDPRPYRAPLQGLNPQVFQYDIRTQPLDNTNLIQVMQTKDNMDIKREQAALERQKMALEKDIKEQELEFKKADMMLDFYAKMLKTTGMKPGLNGEPVVDDITNSPRNQKNQAILAEIATIDKQMEGLAVNLFDKTTPQKMVQLQMRRANLQRGITSTAEETLERATIAKVDNIVSGKVKGMTVNPFIFNDTFSKRRDYLSGVDNGYKFAVTLNEAVGNGMIIDEAAAAKAYDKLVLDANKAVSVDSPEFKKSGRSNLLITTKEQAFTDTETAAGNIADAVLTNPIMRSYFSTKNGINLYDPSKTDADYREIIKNKIKPILALDDEALLKQREVKAQVLSTDPAPKEPTVIRYETTPEPAEKVVRMIYQGLDSNKTVKKETVVKGMENVFNKSVNTQKEDAVRSGMDNIGTYYEGASKDKKAKIEVYLRKIGAEGVDMSDPISVEIVERKVAEGKLDVKNTIEEIRLRKQEEEKNKAREDFYPAKLLKGDVPKGNKPTKRPWKLN